MSARLALLWSHLVNLLISSVSGREPDFVVGKGATDGAYLMRWYLTPWRRWYRLELKDATTGWQRFLAGQPWLQRAFGLLPNAYLHLFLRDDDDRALHDHPWSWCSILLHGGYIEHTIAAGGVHHRQRRDAPSIKFSGPRRAHRIELLDRDQPDGLKVPCWTLFITGPRQRGGNWFFHCPDHGLVHFRDFTDPADTGKTGRGCH